LGNREKIFKVLSAVDPKLNDGQNAKGFSQIQKQTAEVARQEAAKSGIPTQNSVKGILHEIQEVMFKNTKSANKISAGKVRTAAPSLNSGGADEDSRKLAA
jgi:hypothetical protein